MNRRTLITGLISLIAAPAIIRAGSLMPVKTILPAVSDVFEWGPLSREEAHNVFGDFAKSLTRPLIVGDLRYRGDFNNVWIYDGHNWVRIGK
jgi:hypothetical protein